MSQYLPNSAAQANSLTLSPEGSGGSGRNAETINNEYEAEDDPLTQSGAIEYTADNEHQDAPCHTAGSWAGTTHPNAGQHQLATMPEQPQISNNPGHYPPLDWNVDQQSEYYGRYQNGYSQGYDTSILNPAPMVGMQGQSAYASYNVPSSYASTNQEPLPAVRGPSNEFLFNNGMNRTSSLFYGPRILDANNTAGQWTVAGTFTPTNSNLHYQVYWDCESNLHIGEQIEASAPAVPVDPCLSTQSAPLQFSQNMAPAYTQGHDTSSRHSQAGPPVAQPAPRRSPRNSNPSNAGQTSNGSKGSHGSGNIGSGQTRVNSSRKAKKNPSNTAARPENVYEAPEKPETLDYDANISFRYDNQGCWPSGVKYEKEQLFYYFCQRQPTIWVQNHPAQCNDRLTNGGGKECRWLHCPKTPQTITSGWHRVVFDEFPNETSNGTRDPYLVAGAMHLWCFEECFNADWFHRQGWLQADLRNLPLEDVNHMALDRLPDLGVQGEAYDPWLQKQNPNRGAFFLQPEVPYHTNSLAYALMRHHIKRQGGTRENMRKERNKNKNPEEKKTQDVHMGDLRVYASKVNKAKKSSTSEGANASVAAPQAPANSSNDGTAGPAALEADANHDTEAAEMAVLAEYNASNESAAIPAAPEEDAGRGIETSEIPRTAEYNTARPSRDSSPTQAASSMKLMNPDYFNPMEQPPNNNQQVVAQPDENPYPDPSDDLLSAALFASPELASGSIWGNDEGDSALSTIYVQGGGPWGGSRTPSVASSSGSKRQRDDDGSDAEQATSKRRRSARLSGSPS